MEKEKDFIRQLILDYERDICGNIYSYELSDGVTLKLEIKPENVPHLLGVRKLSLRQTMFKSSLEIYDMLRRGLIKLPFFYEHKEEYKKLMNFSRLVNLLCCGDAVKIVKQRGKTKSIYLLYLDHSPDYIIHLGIGQNEDSWYPESLMVLQERNVTAYIKDQLPVDILSVSVENKISRTVLYI